MTRLVSVLRFDLDQVPWFGFVVAESEALLAIHRVSDRYDLDGYCVFRKMDITATLEDFERADLIIRALRLKNQSPISPASIELDTMRSLMRSAQAEYGVLVIHRQHLNPDEIEVGTIRMTSESTFVLRWLDADAKWNNDDRAFHYEDVTHVEFGGEYETTLCAVSRDRGEA
jgi:hypothetical protein